jgi:hypothetical protein
MYVSFESIVNRLFILDLDDNATIYNVSDRRPQPNDLSPIYMWHYFLGPISEKCMKKLHIDGL